MYSFSAYSDFAKFVIQVMTSVIRMVFLYDLNIQLILLSLLFIICVTCILKWILKRRYLIELSSKIPSPKGMIWLPIIGHAHHFIGDTEKLLNVAMKFSVTSVYPRTVYFAHRIYHTIFRPEDMQVVLSSLKTLAKDDIYKFAIPLFGNGLLNLDVKTWRKHRKAIAPTLNQRILDEFATIFSKQCRLMTHLLIHKSINMGEEFDIHEFISRCSMDCVLETSIGIKMNCQTTDINNIMNKINRGLEIAMMRIFNIHFRLDFIYNLTNICKEEKKIVSSFKSFIDNIIVDKKRKYQEYQQLIQDQPEAEITETKKRNVFLDHLIELSLDKNVFTDEEITNEVQTYIIAASDTSSTVTAFTLTCIALFPEIQQKVYEEIIEIMGTERHFEPVDFFNLKYLEMVIKETMRLFPVGPLIVRKVAENLELETCTLSKGTGLVLLILPLHRSSIYYKDPLKFIPERFTPEEVAKRHPYAYLPFSAGPRNCLGPKYGMMLVKCMVASIIRNFVVSTEYKSIEDIRIKQTVIIKPVLGYKVNLTLRGRT